MGSFVLYYGLEVICMRRECMCLHCTASVEEAEWYFGLFCEYVVEESEECRPIAAAPTLHLFGDLGRINESADPAFLHYLRCSGSATDNIT